MYDLYVVERRYVLYTVIVLLAGALFAAAQLVLRDQI
jgi:hypothetical protein